MATTSTTPGAPSSTPAVAFKRLTPAEMVECRKQGLCYNCDEQYTRSHRCPRLFFLKVIDCINDNSTEPPMVTDTETLVVSLHAVTGIHTEDTMRLKVL